MPGALRIDVQNDRQDRLRHSRLSLAATLTHETSRSICVCAWFDALLSPQRDLAYSHRVRRWCICWAFCNTMYSNCAATEAALAEGAYFQVG